MQVYSVDNDDEMMYNDKLLEEVWTKIYEASIKRNWNNHLRRQSEKSRTGASKAPPFIQAPVRGLYEACTSPVRETFLFKNAHNFWTKCRTEVSRISKRSQEQGLSPWSLQYSIYYV